MEDGLIGLDGHGDWSLGDGFLESWARFLLHGRVVLNGDFALLLGELARSVSSLVWVGFLKLLTMVLSIDEGILLPSTIATIRGGIAVDELLLRKLEEVSSLDGVDTLDGSGG